MSGPVVSIGLAKRNSEEREARKMQSWTREIFVVLDKDGRIVIAFNDAWSCNEHINDAIQEHDIAEAKDWVVRRFVRAEKKMP